MNNAYRISTEMTIRSSLMLSVMLEPQSLWTSTRAKAIPSKVVWSYVRSRPALIRLRLTRSALKGVIFTKAQQEAGWRRLFIGFQACRPCTKPMQCTAHGLSGLTRGWEGSIITKRWAELGCSLKKEKNIAQSKYVLNFFQNRYAFFYFF